MKIDPTKYYEQSLDAALYGTYMAHGDAAMADCCIAAAFGQRDDGGIGASNQALATYVQSLPNQVPLILQHEIAQAMDSVPDAAHVIERSRQPSQRLDTLEFLEQSAEYMQQRGYRCAVLVGHPNHLPWLDFLCGQIGIATVVPEGLAGIPFDPESSQAWTRSLAAWQTEVLARQQAGNERKALS